MSRTCSPPFLADTSFTVATKSSRNDRGTFLHGGQRELFWCLVGETTIHNAVFGVRHGLSISYLRDDDAMMNACQRPLSRLSKDDTQLENETRIHLGL